MACEAVFENVAFDGEVCSFGGVENVHIEVVAEGVSDVIVSDSEMRVRCRLDIDALIEAFYSIVFNYVIAAVIDVDSSILVFISGGSD